MSKSSLEGVHEACFNYFAHTKAVISGVDWRASAVKYLGTTDEIVHLAVVDTVLSMLKRRGITPTARPAQAPTVQPAQSSDKPAIPSLEEFINENGLQDFSYQECIDQFNEKFGVNPEEKPNKKKSANSDEFVLVAGFKIVTKKHDKSYDFRKNITYQRTRVDPRIEAVSEWFEKDTAKALASMGIDTVGDLEVWLAMERGMDAMNASFGKQAAKVIFFKCKMLVWESGKKKVQRKDLELRQLCSVWSSNALVSDPVKEMYKQSITRLVAWLERCRKIGYFKIINYDDCAEYAKWITTTEKGETGFNKISEKTAKVQVSIIRNFYNWLSEQSIIESNPWETEVIKLTRKANCEKPINRSSSLNGINISDLDCESDLRSASILATMEITGFKMKKIISLEASDVELNKDKSEVTINLAGIKFTSSDMGFLILNKYDSAKKVRGIESGSRPFFSSISDSFSPVSYQSAREAVNRMLSRVGSEIH